MPAPWVFPGGPVVKTPCFHCREHGFSPFQGTKIAHALKHGQKKRKCQLHCRPAVCVHASDYLSELCFPCAIRPKQANNKPLLSSKYLGHVKISLITSIMYFKVGFWIYITTVHQLYLISLLGSRHSMAAEQCLPKTSEFLFQRPVNNSFQGTLQMG